MGLICVLVTEACSAKLASTLTSVCLCVCVREGKQGSPVQLVGWERCGNGGSEEEKEGGGEKVVRREGEVCLSHSGSVGVCLSSPLSHKQQRRSERVLFPSIMYNTLSKLSPIYSSTGWEVPYTLQHRLIRRLFTNKLGEVNTAQKLTCMSKQEAQMRCSDLTGEKTRRKKWHSCRAGSLFLQLWERMRSLLQFLEFLYCMTIPHYEEKTNKGRWSRKNRVLLGENSHNCGRKRWMLIYTMLANNHVNITQSRKSSRAAVMM